MTETCEYIQHLLDIDQQALEQSRGSVISIDAPTAEGASAGVTYASKLQVPGWKDCAIFSYDETASDDDPYVDHTLHCFFLELESERAARSYVKSVYRCTKDVFSERSFSEAWQAGGYDMIGFEGEVTPAGKGVPVYFGSTTYARLSVDSLDEEVSVVVNYQFLKTPVPDGAEGKGERIILR